MQLRLFTFDSCNDFGNRVSESLQVDPYQPLTTKEEKCFDDGECYVASLENVRGADCFVINSCYSDNKESVNDKLMKMWTFIGSLKDASAGRVTAVLPYFPYARQDRKTNSRAPITTKYVAKLFESVGANRILTIDAHNPTALQNAFGINVDLLEAAGLFAKYIASQIKANKFGVASPKNTLSILSDVGGMTRVRRFRKVLASSLFLEEEDIDIACMDKLHTNSGEITAERIVGNVKGKRIIVLDDMIASGKTIYECAQASEAAGALSIEAVCATHGLFVGKANSYLDHPFVKRLVITDTILPFRLTNVSLANKLVVLGTAELFAEAIMRTHRSESISDLIENGFHSLEMIS
jgi:ribose-phosphate pyrophosphokinase